MPNPYPHDTAETYASYRRMFILCLACIAMIAISLTRRVLA